MLSRQAVQQRRLAQGQPLDDKGQASIQAQRPTAAIQRVPLKTLRTTTLLRLLRKILELHELQKNYYSTTAQLQNYYSTPQLHNSRTPELLLQQLLLLPLLPTTTTNYY